MHTQQTQPTHARTHFAVVEDRGRHRQIPIGPERATVEEAEADLEELKTGHPGAYVRRLEWMDKDDPGVELNQPPPTEDQTVSVPVLGAVGEGSAWTATLCWGFFTGRPDFMPAKFLGMDKDPVKGWHLIEYETQTGRKERVVWSGHSEWNHPLFMLYLPTEARQALRSAILKTASQEAGKKVSGPPLGRLRSASIDLPELNPLEREALTRVYGLDGQPIEKLSQVAAWLHMTADHVDSLCREALAKVQPEARS